MKKGDKRPEILIVNGYHPKETFAVKVGGYLFHHISIPGVKVVKYNLKQDKDNSTRNLRHFIAQFDPSLPAIVLHSDFKFGSYAAIIYRSRSRKESRRARKLILNFSLSEKNVIALGRFLTPRAKHSFIDIELGTGMGLQKAVNLIENFCEHLIKRASDFL